MTLILSGTDGLSDVDGSAATPAIRGSDTNTGMFFPAADTIAFSEGGVESMRLDSAGNVGLGVTPSPWAGGQAVQLGARGGLFYRTDLASTELSNNSYYNSGVGYVYQASAAATLYRQSSGAHSWFNASSGTAGNTTNYTQAMTLDSSGNLLVGTTSTPSASVNGVRIGPPGSNFWISSNAGTSSYGHMLFFNANGQIGSISTSGSGTSFITTSDYRLKENVQPMTGALAKVQALKPVTYKWKVDGSDGQGFIAHELQEVCPDAVSGEKDAVNEDGSIKPQGIDTSFLVATLTAAIQELKAEVDALKARLGAQA